MATCLLRGHLLRSVQILQSRLTLMLRSGKACCQLRACPLLSCQDLFRDLHYLAWTKLSGSLLQHNTLCQR